MVASERAILAALDANLELAIRSLRAEHVALDHRRLSTSSIEQSHTFNLLPIARELVRCARRLRQLIANYRTAIDALLVTADEAFESPDVIDDTADSDLPF